MKQEKSLKKNAALNVIKNIMSIIFPIITFPYASRILLPDGMGQINFANSIVSYFSMLAGLGIGTYGCREVARLRDKTDELNKFCSEALLINLISTAAAYILLIIAVIIIPFLHNYSLLIFISSLNIFLLTVGIGWVYGGLEEYGYITVRTIMFQFVSIILIFTLVKTKADIYRYMLISVISAAGSNILNIIHSRKFIKLKLIDKKLELKKHISPIFKLFSITIFVSVYNILDTTMLGFLSDDKQVGFYSAATKINRMVLTLITAFSAVMFPRLAYYANNSKKEELKLLIQKNLTIIIYLSLPMIVGLNILSTPIILLFCGEKFISAVPVMKIMNPIIFIIINIKLLPPLSHRPTYSQRCG
ncbi:flippase, partial [Treponema sp.]|uniref:flippase n=1 Tax=Treponema sp. TaxID=166 RepID=UPI00388DE498